MPAPNTGSVLEAEGGLNRTATAVSTNIILEVDGDAIGAVQTLSVREQRSIVMIDEVGSDGHVDSVPNKSTDITGSCRRTRFDNQRIATAFGRPYIHVAAQRIPFDIVIKDIFSGTDSILTTTIKNVWMEQVDYEYKSDDFVIVENMSWKAETIFSQLTGGSNAVPLGVKNFRQVNPIERAADRGRRRGALDGAGLLNAIQEAA